MNCKYLKQKLNKKLECKLNNKIITLKDCSNCKYKEYKCTINQINCANHQNKTLKNTMIDKTTAKHSKNKQNNRQHKSKIKSRSNKLAKLERNRTSLFTDDLEHCILCGKSKDHLHEIFFGKNRVNSIKYKLVIPVCFECHNKIHNDIKLQNEWFIKGQTRFNEVYPDLDFVEIFKRNWL